MRKILLATTLLGVASPALSGPIMDGLLGSASYTAKSEIVIDGIETYEGFEITRRDNLIVAEKLVIHEEGGQVHLQITGTDFFSAGKNVGGVTSVSASFDPSLRDTMLSMHKKGADHPLFGEMIDRESCKDLDLPMSVEAEGFLLDDERQSRIEIGTMSVNYDISDAAGDCIVEIGSHFENLKHDGANGFLVEVDKIELNGRGSVLTAAAPANLADVYTAQGEIEKLSVSMNGVEQFSVDRIFTESASDASLTAALVETGYFTAVNDLAKSDGSASVQEIVPMSQVASIWNALRTGDTRNSFGVENARITGEMPMAMTGLPVFAAGRSLDLSVQTNKEDAAVEVILDVNSDALVDLGLSMSLLMTELDPGMGDMHPSALMMSAPVSISGVGIKFIDEGIGDLVADMTGFDLYQEVPSMAAGALGPQKAEKIGTWLSAAKNGGAYFMATPSAPLPVMQAFVGFMGDWDAFGNMINGRSAMP
ncbi:hypothetical protein [Pseudosulfitobacter pseudonitzschiae]|uniref:hypothetical protein n=1 Tax=Pseudosulfitobacter pseudonitzschiae TaxID=1402135 RepID=UPI003B796596